MHRQVLIVGDESQLEKVQQQLAQLQVHHGQLIGASLQNMRLRDAGVAQDPATSALVMAIRPYFCNFRLQVHHRRGLRDGRKLPKGVWLQPLELTRGMLKSNGDKYFDIHNVVIAPNGANRIYATPHTQIVFQGQQVAPLDPAQWEQLEFPDPNAPLPGQLDRFSLINPSTWPALRQRQHA